MNFLDSEQPEGAANIKANENQPHFLILKLDATILKRRQQKTSIKSFPSDPHHPVFLRDRNSEKHNQQECNIMAIMFTSMWNQKKKN